MRRAAALYTLPLLSLFLPLAAPAQQMPAPEFYGQIVLPTGLMIGGTEIGGISGLDYNPPTNHFLAISDDRAENGPARYYEIGILPANGRVKLNLDGVYPLTGVDGKGFAPKSVDPESIRIDAKTGEIYWTSENDAAGAPAIYSVRPDGTNVKSLPIPEPYLPNADGTRGVRSNYSFEGLALGDNNTLVVATENALVQDGEKSTPEAGSRSRILVLDRDSGAVKGEYLYVTDPVFAKPTAEPPLADNGISELLPLGGNRYAVLERGFAMGVGNRISIYIIDLPAPADTTSVAAMAADAKPLDKTLWFKLDEGDFGLDIDNIEGITFGPEIDGKRSLVLASDNNFSPSQITQFLVFTLPK